jgi:glycosyltransferase involved in cell wall biosynthesis
LEPLSLPPCPRVRFLFDGGTIFRKGIDPLLAAFARAIRPTDDAGLLVKDMGSKSFHLGQTAGSRIAALRERGYSVEYVDRSMSEPEMAALYAACDCLVHPFRGEGFALPVVEAMACGLPVIATGAGPMLDYATDETAFLTPARRGQFAECRVGDIESVSRPWLHEPALDARVELLQRVAGDKEVARAKRLASQHIRSHFTWKHTVDAVERRPRAVSRLHDRRRMDADLQGWELAEKRKPRPAIARSPNGFKRSSSDPCFISGSRSDITKSHDFVDNDCDELTVSYILIV